MKFLKTFFWKTGFCKLPPALLYARSASTFLTHSNDQEGSLPACLEICGCTQVLICDNINIEEAFSRCLLIP